MTFQHNFESMPITSKSFDPIRIDIMTFRPEESQTVMNDHKTDKPQIMCTICLNSKNDINKYSNNTNRCPCSVVDTKVKRFNKDTEQTTRSIQVQTSEIDLAKGFNLLNEVLTEFQNKKSKSKPSVKDASVSTEYKTIKTNLLNEVLTEFQNKKLQLKPSVVDASVSTENKLIKNNLLNEILTEFQNKKLKLKPSVVDASVSTEFKKPELCLSRVFVYTVEGDLGLNKFTVICSSKDDFQDESKVDFLNESLNLLKQKSSSIPQMKMEELKNSLKEKSTSRDTLEEVNRLFGNVHKNRDFIKTNRPQIRQGPRILPVVITKTENSSESRKTCKCCQSVHCMSSGDSVKKNTNIQNGKCDKCVYLLCCHYKNCNKMQSLICDDCQNKNIE